MEQIKVVEYTAKTVNFRSISYMKGSRRPYIRVIHLKIDGDKEEIRSYMSQGCALKKCEFPHMQCCNCFYELEVTQPQRKRVEPQTNMP